ncbi:hypothetical protein V3C99_007299 [Haemonchus contortus]
MLCEVLLLDDEECSKYHSCRCIYSLTSFILTCLSVLAGMYCTVGRLEYRSGLKFRIRSQSSMIGWDSVFVLIGVDITNKDEAGAAQLNGLLTIDNLCSQCVDKCLLL